MNYFNLLVCASLLVVPLGCTSGTPSKTQSASPAAPAAQSPATKSPANKSPANKSAVQTTAVAKDVTLKLTGL